MSRKIRGADIVVRALERAGCTCVFTLSGNHIMPIFDAAFGSGLRLVHVRHEAAAVHMADAWGRLTGQCGIALVSGGAAHANAVAALTTAAAAESPVLLLSGHAGHHELGRGAFQELRQVEMAAPVSKAAWMARTTQALAGDIAHAIATALSGRPGPVHVSLPFDLLTAATEIGPDLIPDAQAFCPRAQRLAPTAADQVLARVRQAKRPLFIGGPRLCHGTGPALLSALRLATGVPAIGLESPRGVNDPSLGLLAEVLSRADLIVLLGKALDFTLGFAEAPFVDPAAGFIGIDPDAALLARLAQDKGERLQLSTVADPGDAAETLTARAQRPASPAAGPSEGASEGASDRASEGASEGASDWASEVDAALAYRPATWSSAASASPGALHPLQLCRAIAPRLAASDAAVLICDGGEIGQWPQAALAPRRRLINGVAGAIGAAIPFAIAARVAEPKAPIIAVMGDGSFGFHMAEIDTAVRYGLPFVAVVGNDASWNAEQQIQLRDYGRQRVHGLGLLPTRYDLVATALGGHGELVTEAEALAGALARALASGKPACVNVMIEGVPAPRYQR